MIILRKHRLIQRASIIAIVAMGAAMLLNACLDAPFGGDDTFISTGASCVCNGTTLHCDANAQLAAADYQNSKYCDAPSIKSTGNCGCQGTTMACQVAMCTFNTGGCFGFMTTKFPAACNPNTFANSSVPGQIGSNTHAFASTVLFPNDPECASAPPPPPPPTPSGGGGGSSGGGGGGGGGVCACEGVDNICKNADGSIKSASYNAAECGGSGACGCRGPNSTLACPDGTYADFNPTCTGGGSGTCGNGVCDPGEDSTNCQGDCGKP